MPALRVALVLAGVFVGLMAASVFDLGAKFCQDVFTGVNACALPQPSGVGMALGTAVGASVPLLAFRFGDRRRRG